MDPPILVHIDLKGQTHFVGRLWIGNQRGKTHASFEYDKAWTTNAEAFALDPVLRLDPPKHHTQVDRDLFGAISDSAPDKWGYVLMQRHEEMTAKSQGRAPRTLQTVDYLLGVNDVARSGALRFALPDNREFLATSEQRPLPHIHNVQSILASSYRVSADTELLEDLNLLLEPGASVGGARPKACVYDQNGNICLLKFPSVKDKWDVVVWEYLALSIAKQAGFNVPRFGLIKVADENVLMLERFDRNATHRIPFLSAMCLLNMSYGEPGSYENIAEAINEYGSNPKEDLLELWGRMVLNILMNNVDDHMRNHGFLFKGGGWQLSPLYDLEPTPPAEKARVLNTTVHGPDATASMDLAFAAATNFGISLPKAREIAARVASAVKYWPKFVVGGTLCDNEKELFRSAVDHPEVGKALAGPPHTCSFSM